MQVPRRERRVQGGPGREPVLLRRADRVRGRRRRPQGRRPDGGRQQRVDTHGAQLGRDVAPQQRQETQSAVRAPAHLRLRQGARRQQRHPGRVEARQGLPFLGQLPLKSEWRVMCVRVLREAAAV